MYTKTLKQAMFTAYDIILIRAALIIHRKRYEYSGFQKSLLSEVRHVSDRQVSRPTEKAAFVLMKAGFIPGSAYTGDKFWILPKYDKLRALDWQWLSEDLHKRPGLIGKRCANELCQRWYPLTEEYWHKNGRLPDGSVRWRSECKDCVNGKQAEYRKTGKGYLKIA